jgi:arsenite methyltransferase
MTQYLSYQFNDNETFIETFDEAPLWSAAFGLLLLKHLELKPDLTVIDLGSGTGFPLMELAARLGASGKVYGIDPWVTANTRARKKIVNYGLHNVEIIESSADKIPFADNTVDLIVSNLGINNFEKRDHVFRECYRVLKPEGKLALTTNINGHWKLFYNIFEETARQLGMHELVDKLAAQQEHRGTIASISNLFTDNGLNVVRHVEDQLEMKFVDGTAFLNHYFVKLGWLASWMELVPKDNLTEVFSLLEQNLNTYAKEHGGLALSVPMAFVEGIKS